MRWIVKPGLRRRSETRQYNSLGQLRRLTVSGAVDIEYRYSATQNNGLITQMKDWVSGEEVNYQYDALNRLVAAETTGAGWGRRSAMTASGTWCRRR